MRMPMIAVFPSTLFQGVTRCVWGTEGRKWGWEWRRAKERAVCIRL